MPKKSKSRSADSGAVPVAMEEEEFPEFDVRPDRWVSLQVKLITWDYLNFSLLMRTSARLFTIVDKIRERHGGSISDILLYRHQVLNLRSCGLNASLTIFAGSSTKCFVGYKHNPR